MEGAARSGRLAAGSVLRDPTRFLLPELPPEGIMRLLNPPWTNHSKKSFSPRN